MRIGPKSTDPSAASRSLEASAAPQHEAPVQKPEAGQPLTWAASQAPDTVTQARPPALGSGTGTASNRGSIDFGAWQESLRRTAEAARAEMQEQMPRTFEDAQTLVRRFHHLISTQQIDGAGVTAMMRQTLGQPFRMMLRSVEVEESDRAPEEGQVPEMRLKLRFFGGFAAGLEGPAITEEGGKRIERATVDKEKDTYLSFDKVVKATVSPDGLKDISGLRVHIPGLPEKVSIQGIRLGANERGEQGFFVTIGPISHAAAKIGVPVANAVSQGIHALFGGKYSPISKEFTRNPLFIPFTAAQAP